MRVVGLHLYPVKSLACVTVAQAALEWPGFRGDRRWMVVGPDGRFLTQRLYPAMARIGAELTETGLILTASGHARCVVTAPGEEAGALEVSIWRDAVRAWPAPDGAVHAWLSAVLDTQARLVRMAGEGARPVSSPFGHPGDVVSFADGFPVLLTSHASLDDVNRRLARAVPMDRFRPNIVIDGADPFAEDCWRRIRIGGAVFRVAKPCDRCILTTIDQSIGTQPDGDAPLSALRHFRRDASGRLMFGQNLAPEQCGTVQRGDAVEILESGPPNVEIVPAAESVA